MAEAAPVVVPVAAPEGLVVVALGRPGQPVAAAGAGPDPGPAGPPSGGRVGPLRHVTAAPDPAEDVGPVLPRGGDRALRPAVRTEAAELGAVPPGRVAPGAAVDPTAGVVTAGVVRTEMVGPVGVRLAPAELGVEPPGRVAPGAAVDPTAGVVTTGVVTTEMVGPVGVRLAPAELGVVLGVVPPVRVAPGAVVDPTAGDATTGIVATGGTLEVAAGVTGPTDRTGPPGPVRRTGPSVAHRTPIVHRHGPLGLLRSGSTRVSPARRRRRPPERPTTVDARSRSRSLS